MLAIQRFRQYMSNRNKQRVYIVPTRFGFVFAFFLVVMLLGAINYSNSMGHLLVFLLVSLGHTTMLHTHRNIAKIKLKHAHAEPVFCEQSAQFHVVLQNPTQYDLQQIHLATKQEQTTSLNPIKRFRGFEHHTTVPQINAQQTTTGIVELKTTKRGYQDLGRLRVSSVFPLGLFTSWTHFKTDAKVLVYPKPQGKQSLPATTDQGESAKTSQLKGLDDFAGFNNYREGDPVNTIAWKTVARDDILRTKQFSGMESGQRILSWYETTGDTETRLSQLCKWLVDSEQTNTITKLELPNKVIDYGVGESHLQTCLTALALYQDE